MALETDSGSEETPFEREVTARLAERFGASPGRIELGCVSDKPAISDASRVYIAYADRTPIAAVLQGQKDEDLATRGAELARQVARVLGDELGSAVLVPLESGFFDQSSFVIYPYCQPVAISGFRRRFDHRVFVPEVLGWLREVTQRTVSPPTAEERDRLFAGPLRDLAGLDVASASVRALAEQTAEQLASGAFDPRVVLMHGDLWIGNVLIAPERVNQRSDARKRKRFVVSDWPGAALRGYPIFDLVRLIRSTAVPRRFLTHEIPAHAALLGCAPDQLPLHLGAALAGVYARREQYPVDRFVRMADDCVALLASAS